MKMKHISAAVLASLSTVLLVACSGGGGSSDSAAGPSINTNPMSINLPTHNSSVYNTTTNGPAYSAIQISTNNTLTINAINNNDPGPVNIVPATDLKVYGSLTACTAGLTLQSGDSCYIFLHANKNYTDLFQKAGATHQVISIDTSKGTKYADVYTQGYLYIAGDFTQLGTASISSPGNTSMLAKCDFPNSINDLSCSNALSGNNSANAGIFALASDNAGNVYAGGRFTQLGNVKTSVVGENLVAKYNASTSTISNAFNDNGNPSNPTYKTNTEIDAITFDGNNSMYITGDLTNAGGATATPGSSIDMQFLIAKCDLSKDTNQCSNSNGDNVLKNLSSDFVNGNPIYSLSVYEKNTTSLLLSGGGMDQIGGSTTTYGGSCVLKSGVALSCAELTGSSSLAANDLIYNVIADNKNDAAYIGGTFTTIGSLSSPSQFLAKCDLNSGGIGTCSSNALGTDIYMLGGQGTSFTSPLIRASALDNNGNIFIAGKFNQVTNGTTTFGSSTSGTNMIARCPIGTTSTSKPCQNLLSNAAPNDGANNIVDSMTTNAEINQVSIRVN